LKIYECDGCHKEIEVYDEYEPEFCCKGEQCGCRGMPINPVFCDECEVRVYGRNPLLEELPKLPF